MNRSVKSADIKSARNSKQTRNLKEISRGVTADLRILIATDNHLGYKEADGFIGKDSFNAFDECLDIANKEEVDFVLLGGDLFHEARPSARTYFEASQIFNRHVFGSASPGKMAASQNSVAFKTLNYPNANYMDKNHRIKMPIFSIHGNHDHPVGLELFSSMDQLGANSYINYFGKVTNIESIEVEPVLLTKRDTKLAIYGIGHIKDMRLNMAFQKNQITFHRPLNADGQPDD